MMINSCVLLYVFFIFGAISFFIIGMYFFKDLFVQPKRGNSRHIGLVILEIRIILNLSMRAVAHAAGISLLRFSVFLK